MSENPLKDAANGAAQGVLEFLATKVGDWIVRLNNRDIAFIGNKETILAVRRERESPDWRFINQFLPDFDLRIQVLMGFGLREYEKDKARLEDLRTRIQKRYGSAGLHVAELAACGIVGELLNRLISITGGSTADVQRALISFLKNSETLAIFIHQHAKIEHIIESAKIRLESMEPHMLMFFAKGTMRPNLKKIIKKLEEDGYIPETSSERDEMRAFVFTQEARPRILHWSDFLPLEDYQETRRMPEEKRLRKGNPESSSK